jgi:hypothetical protein
MEFCIIPDGPFELDEGRADYLLQALGCQSRGLEPLITDPRTQRQVSLFVVLPVPTQGDRL